MSRSDRSLHFSDSFVISCGTVTLDLKARKVLLIRWRDKNEYLLPKGRKDVGETLEQAALRETYEETGYKARLLSLEISTLATSPASESAMTKAILPDATEAGADTKQVTPEDNRSLGPRTVHCSEPIAIQQRLAEQGSRKIIFWFAAEGDSSQPPDLGTQLNYEDFEPVWVQIDEKDPETTLKTLVSYEDDRSIVAKLIDLATAQNLFQ